MFDDERRSGGAGVVFNIIILLILIGAIGFGYVKFKDLSDRVASKDEVEISLDSLEQSVATIIDQNLAELDQEDKSEVGDSYTYTIGQESLEDGNTRQFLTRSMEGGDQQEIVISDLFAQYGQYFRILGVIHQEDALLMENIELEGSSINRRIYKLNPRTKDLTALQVNNDVSFPDYGVKLVSPSGDYLAWVPLAEGEIVASKMYMVNTLDDTYRVLITLDEGESFSSAIAGGLESRFHFEWLDESTIRYSVYAEGELVRTESESLFIK